MSIQPNCNLLTILRHNVHCIEEDAGEDLSPDAIEVKALLLRRIAMIEAALARIAEFAAADAHREGHRCNPSRTKKLPGWSQSEPDSDL
jgi:hypothetical protein